MDRKQCRDVSDGKKNPKWMQKRDKLTNCMIWVRRLAGLQKKHSFGVFVRLKIQAHCWKRKMLSLLKHA